MEESSDSEVDDCSITITKKSLRKAIALMGEDELSKEKFGGHKSMRECQLPSLQAHSLCSAADIFSGDDNVTRQMLEVLRMSFLENNYSAAAKLLECILRRATKPELPILWKSAMVLFLNEDCSNQRLLDEFLEMCADQRIPEHKQELMKLLVSLPDPVLASKTKKLSRNDTSVTDSRSVTENEDPDDPDFIFP